MNNYQSRAVCRPMVDLELAAVTARELFFYSDASANQALGFGAIFQKRWIFAQWENGFIKSCNPSIEYLELVGLAAALLTWGELIMDQKVIFFCDNTAVVAMVNNMTSSCENCMYLLRLIMLDNLIHNRRVFIKYVRTFDNYLADALSRLQFDRFWKLAPKGTNPLPCKLSSLVWPVSNIWIK